MSEKTADRTRFDQLMQAGRRAYDNGDPKAAHNYWRQAAVADPYNEKVWIALMRVIDNDDDRMVCLENIVAINPSNHQARRRLRIEENRRMLVEARAASRAGRLLPSRTLEHILAGVLLLAILAAVIAVIVVVLVD